MEPLISLQIITPEQTLVDCKASLVELPGVCGRFEVLKDHAPLITALTGGKLRYVAADGEHYCEIKTGFVEVCDNKVMVCAEL